MSLVVLIAGEIVYSMGRSECESESIREFLLSTRNVLHKSPAKMLFFCLGSRELSSQSLSRSRWE